MKIAIGCDKLAVELKDHIIGKFGGHGHEFVDMGVAPGEDVDYPEIAQKTAEAIAAGKYRRGILLCGTGIGMAMAANKVPGIRAAVCHDIYSAERSILSNNAHILCMGALIVGKATVDAMVSRWLELEFKEGPSSIKVEKINRIDAAYKSRTQSL